jgi:tRNA(Ile)-lysidine synthase
VLIAVSGGADSVGLLRAMAAVRRPGNGRLMVAHYNHCWRGAASDADEAFVRELSRQMNLPCEVGRNDAPGGGTLPGTGGESAARRARYDFFRATADRVAARYVATAHTATDQQETILHRIVRGTGLGGLGGIPRTRPLSRLTTLVRPLLAVERHELRRYLQDLAQPFRHDATNESVRYTRNRIRNELMPDLERHYNPQVGQAILRLGHLARQAQEVIDHLVDLLSAQCVECREGSPVRVNRTFLQAQPDYLVRELLIALWRTQRWPARAMDASKWHAICQLVRAPANASSRVSLPGSVTARVEGDHLELAGPPQGLKGRKGRKGPKGQES